MEDKTMMKNLVKKVVTLTVAAALVISTGAVAFGASGSYIGEEKAIEKALKDANAKKSTVSFLECERDDDDGLVVYEIEFRKDSKEYSYTINAKTGNIREKSVEYGYVRSNKAKISESTAKKKVFSFSGIKQSKVSDLTCYYDYDDGKEIYEVKFRKGNYLYEYDVNARSGKIVEYSKEYSKAYY